MDRPERSYGVPPPDFALPDATHARRLVIVIATGTVTRDTVVSYFDTQRRLEGLTYPRLVECRELDVRLTNDDWREVTAWLRTMVQGRTIGPPRWSSTANRVVNSSG